MFKPASKWDIGAIAQEKAARKRSSWSAFEPPTEEEITKVADLLGFAPEAMQIAASRGLLFCATCRDGHRSFVVADSRKLSAAAVRLRWSTMGADQPDIPHTSRQHGRLASRH